jgi:hypothetical protein
MAETSVGNVGTLAAGTGALPSEVCLVAKLSTALATRSGRGRLFFASPIYSSYLSSPDQWNTGGAYWTAVNAFLTSLKNGLDVTHDTIAHHYSLRVWSRKRGDSHDVTGYSMRQQPHWLRSRLTAP